MTRPSQSIVCQTQTAPMDRTSHLLIRQHARVPMNAVINALRIPKVVPASNCQWVIKDACRRARWMKIVPSLPTTFRRCIAMKVFAFPRLRRRDERY